MKPTAYPINAARGSIVDEAALYRALQEEKIAGAGLDVLEQEPIDPSNPLVAMDNVLTAPHIGGATKEASSRSSVACARLSTISSPAALQNLWCPSCVTDSEIKQEHY